MKMFRMVAAAAAAVVLAFALPVAGQADDAMVGLPLTAEYFPDTAFRTALAAYDADGDGVLTGGERDIRYLSLEAWDIYSFEGVENLPLRSLSISSGTLTMKELDLSGCKALESFSCWDAGELETLILPADICDVTCNGGGLVTLDVSACSRLETLQLSDNRLIVLDISACTELTTLNVSDNMLTELDVTGCPALTNLYVQSNRLTELDVSQNPELEWLDCGGNRLKTLDITQNPGLEWLSCESNLLEELDVSANPKLEGLWCYDNAIAQLDLSQNTLLARDSVGAPSDCRIHYAHLGGWNMGNWKSIWMLVRVVLAAVALVGGIVWAVQGRKRH